MKIGRGALALFIDHIPASEAIESIGGVELMKLIPGDRMGETPPRGWRCLEASIAPAAIQIEALDRSLVDDGTSIHGHVHDAAPGSQQPQPRDARYHGNPGLDHMLDHRQVAAARV